MKLIIVVTGLWALLDTTLNLKLFRKEDVVRPVVVVVVVVTFVPIGVDLQKMVRLLEDLQSAISEELRKTHRKTRKIIGKM